MTLQARLYNLQTAQIIQAQFRYTGSGKGPVQFTLPDGAACLGEYVTMDEGETSWGMVFSTVYPAGSASVVGGSAKNTQKGQAVATCPDGQLFDCEYVTSSTSAQGHGACKDNRGQTFRLMF